MTDDASAARALLERLKEALSDAWDAGHADAIASRPTATTESAERASRTKQRAAQSADSLRAYLALPAPTTALPEMMLTEMERQALCRMVEWAQDSTSHRVRDCVGECPICADAATLVGALEGNSLRATPLAAQPTAPSDEPLTICPCGCGAKMTREQRTTLLEEWHADAVREALPAEPNEAAPFTADQMRSPSFDDLPVTNLLAMLEETKPLIDDVLKKHQPQFDDVRKLTCCGCGLEFHRIDARAWYRHAAAMVLNALVAALRSPRPPQSPA